MNAPAAFKAEYADWKLIKSRRVVQIVLEIPLEEANAAHTSLGGMPNPAESLWLGVARLNTELPPTSSNGDVALSPLPGTDGRKPGTQSKAWSSMSPAQQAGIRCNEPPFHLFLAERYAVNIRGSIDAVAFVRAHCRVASRADMNADHSAALLWRQLDSEFSTWKHHPEMVP